MNCSHVRQQLAELIYGDLDPKETSALQEHLEACPDCRTEAAGLKRLRQTLEQALVQPL